jgi:hypothetical protein
VLELDLHPIFRHAVIAQQTQTPTRYNEPVSTNAKITIWIGRKCEYVCKGKVKVTTIDYEKEQDEKIGWMMAKVP